MTEDRCGARPGPRPKDTEEAGPASGDADVFTSELVVVAEQGAVDGFLMPDELQELCRAVLEHVARRGP